MHAEGGRELVLLFGSVIGPYYSAWAFLHPGLVSKLVIPKFIFVGVTPRAPRACMQRATRAMSDEEGKGTFLPSCPPVNPSPGESLSKTRTWSGSCGPTLKNLVREQAT